MHERSSGRGRVWVIHGAALAVLFAIYAWVFRDVWGSTAYGPYAEAFALAFLVPLLGYAVVTTVVVAFVGRRWRVPLVMHGLAFAAAGLFWCGKALPMWAAEAEMPAIAADEEMLKGCLHIDDVRVSPGPAMRATMSVTSECIDTVPLRQVWLQGFDLVGGSRSLRAPQPMSDLARGQTVHVALESVGIPSTKTHDGDGWTWQVSVDVEGPRPVLVCFATPDAPIPVGCAALQRVEVVHGGKP